jgi:formamidopyrimidine-DNA glycosylase
MPELPEVENIIIGLKKNIVRKTISNVDINLDKIVKNPVKSFKKEIKGSTIEKITRQGKFLIFDLSGKYTLIIHLKMSGFLLLTNKSKQPTKHTHLIFYFKDFNKKLFFIDVRRFGYAKLIKSNKLENFLDSKIGPDYLKISYDDFYNTIKSKNRIIKSLLLDQKIFSGLGNIYTSESLYRSRIHPKQKSSQISNKKIKKLYDSIKNVLEEAINLGGSSVSNYLHPDGAEGSYQRQHKVYQRQGKRCKRCGSRIKNIKINNRSSYYCPKCQKL